MKQPPLAELRFHQFGTQIMEVEDEPLAEQLVWQRIEEQDVRRIADLDHVKARAAGDLRQQTTLVKQGAQIFDDKAEFAPRLKRQGVAVDGNSVNELERERMFLCLGADHRDLPTRVA